MQRIMMTGAEVADYLRISRSSVCRMLKTREIPGEIGSDWRFNIESVDRWRASKEEARKPPRGH